MSAATSRKLASAALASLAGLLMAVLPPGAARAEVSMQATGTQNMTYASNPLLAVQNPGALWGSTTTPEMLLKDTTENSQASLDTTIDENIFNQSVYNSTDLHDTAYLSTQNQHWTAALSEHTDYDTTRTSELTVFGNTPTVARHTGLSLAPQLTYSPWLTDTFALAGSALSSRYNSSIFTNYDNFEATPSWTHAFDERNAGIFEVQTQQYQSTGGIPSLLDSAGPLIGWRTTFSPRLSANAAVGAQASRQFLNGIAAGTWGWNYVFTGGLNFKGEQDTLNLQTQRQEFPYGNGTAGLQTNVALNENHNVNSALTLNFSLFYLTTDYQITLPGSLQDQTGVSLGATWHATEQVDLSATYQYRYETLISSDATPQDNSVMLSLAYRPKLWTLMR